MFVASEAGKVVAGEINSGLSCTQKLGFWSIGALNDVDGIEVTLLFRVERHRQWFGVPLVNKLIDFLKKIKIKISS